eukprot:c23967_g1_i1 orf=103-690(+)
MARKKVCMLWLLVSVLAAGGVGRAEKEQEESSGIPGWVDAYGAPRVNLSLSFLDKPLRSGQLVRKNLTQTRPHVSLHVPPPLARSFLTLAIVDPDAPSPTSPIRANVLHWIVSDIPPSRHYKKEIWESGVESVPYMGPSPPNGTHRYYALVFEQKGKINVEPIQNRTNFSIREFTRTHNLYYLVGGTFFRVRANR